MCKHTNASTHTHVCLRIWWNRRSHEKAAPSVCTIKGCQWISVLPSPSVHPISNQSIRVHLTFELTLCRYCMCTYSQILDFNQGEFSLSTSVYWFFQGEKQRKQWVLTTQSVTCFQNFIKWSFRAQTEAFRHSWTNIREKTWKEENQTLPRTHNYT